LLLLTIDGLDVRIDDGGGDHLALHDSLVHGNLVVLEEMQLILWQLERVGLTLKV
jgi:hypothetical protein